MANVVSSVSTARNLTSRLCEIGKNIENAELKNLLADLSLRLVEAEVKIADLVSENTKMKEIIDLLENKTGELCPRCKKRAFKLITTKPYLIYGEVGYKESEYKCSGCGFTNTLIT
ncbi:MAG: hypothetical protein JRF02_05295 [Deltaproteobacteria bacterium]|nr:hypothetical protein [Deltaproteobacteria bacterium]